MKIMLLSLFILAGCATKADKALVVESKEIKPIGYEQKKLRLKKLLSAHPEFDEMKRAKIEKLLITSLEENQELRKRESQLIQQVARYTLVDQGSYTQVKKLKLELKKVYDKKYANVSATIEKLKKIVGINIVNKSLMNDFQKDHILEFR